MALEAATYINDLDIANPPGTDSKSQGDDHIRLIKAAMKATFPLAVGVRKLSDATDSAADTLSFTLFRNRKGPVPLADDLLASYTISGNDSTLVETTYARIQAKIIDPTNGSEDGALLIKIPVAGVETTKLTVDSTGVVSPGITSPSIHSTNTLVVDGLTTCKGQLQIDPSNQLAFIGGGGQFTHICLNGTMGVYNVTPGTLRHYMYFSGTPFYQFDTGFFIPNTNGGSTLGTFSFRWGQIYSTVGTISTSDENLKQEIRPLTSQEIACAKALKGIVRAYRLKSEVEKDEAEAKTRIGVIAQQVKAVFDAQGLDIKNYAFYSEDEQYTETFNEETLSHDRHLTGEVVRSIVYDELQCFILAAMMEDWT